MYLEARNSIYVNSPASISQRAKSPMRTSPFTVHFCVSQFGLQLWFINRDEFPFGPASITRSYEVKTHVKTPELKKARWRSFLSSEQCFGVTDVTLVRVSM